MPPLVQQALIAERPASAFTSAGSARVGRAASPLSRTGVTTVFRPGRRRMASGTRTVMLVATVMRPA